MKIALADFHPCLAVFFLRCKWVFLYLSIFFIIHGLSIYYFSRMEIGSNLKCSFNVFNFLTFVSHKIGENCDLLFLLILLREAIYVRERHLDEHMLHIFIKKTNKKQNSSNNTKTSMILLLFSLQSSLFT